MPRLRVTTALSLLALFIGTWGTGWLSGLTDGWTGPPPRARAQATRAHRPDTYRRRPARPHVIGAEAAAHTTPVPAALPLVPLDTPPGQAPWIPLRGHLDGRVVLHIATDRSGRVSTARIVQSSGDPVLDAHALATVQRWRFAVPDGAPGVQGELPMRFDSTPPSTPP